MTPLRPQDAGAGRAVPALALVGLVGALLGGCESPARVKPWRHAADPEVAATAAPRSPALADDTTTQVRAGRDHTLRVAMDAEPRGLNPLVNPSTWTLRTMVGTVYETLVRYQRTPAGGEYASGLARGWRIGAGGTEIRIELEPEATWHDGKPVTSSDVQFTLDLVRDSRSGLDHLRWMLASVAAVELVAPREVRIRLARPDAWVLRALAIIPILPMHVHGAGLAAGGAIVGSGPWKLASWKDGTIHLTASGTHRAGPPAIADLEFVLLPDAAHALTLAKRGEIDVVPELIPTHWPEQASAPGIQASFAPLQLAPARLRYVLFDAGAAPTDDARVRQALGLLIDRRGLARDVHDGLARPIAAPVWPGGPIDGAELDAPAFDPAAAGRLLDAAGWTDHDKDGVRDRGGHQLRLDVLVVERDTADAGGSKRADPERDRVIEAWKRAGIGADLRGGSEGVVMNRLESGDFDVAFVEWSGSADMDLSPWLGTGRGENLARIASPRLDRALAALADAWEPGERTRLGGDVAAAFVDEMPWAPIVAAVPQGLVHRRVQGVTVADGWIDFTRLSLAP